MDVNSFIVGYTKGKQSASGGGGSGVELNIAYGDTPPEDTTKLWVKTSEPSGVLVSTNPDYEAIPAHTVTELSATLLTANWRMDAAVVGEKIYIFGGNLGTQNGTKKIQCFDTLTKILEVLPVDMPYVMNNVCCAAYNDNIYLFGGCEYSDATTWVTGNHIMRFDPNTQAFEILDVVLPKPILGSCASCVGSKIYIFGGSDGSASTNAIWCFDVETETITTLDTVLPTTVNRGASCVIGTKIYVVYVTGGKADVYCFDTETETVSTLSIERPMSLMAQVDVCAAAVGDYLYMYSTYSSYVVEYNPLTQTASVVGMIPQEKIETNVSFKYKMDMVCGVVDGKVYAFGGRWDRSSGVYWYSDKIYCHNPMGGKDYLVEENDLLIIPRMESDTFPIINAKSAKIEIGVDSVYKGNEEGKGEEVEAALYKDGAWTTI
jgi:N-acetylneuraminic acid mutarotase